MADVFTRLAHFRDFLLEKTRAVAERVSDSASRAAKVLGRGDSDAGEAEAINRDIESGGRQDLRDAEREVRRQLKEKVRGAGGRLPASLGEKVLGAAERVEKKVERVGWVRRLLSRINWGTFASTASAWGLIGVLAAVGYHYSPPSERGEPPQSQNLNLKMPDIPPIPDTSAVEKEVNKAMADAKQLHEQSMKMAEQAGEYIRWRDGLAEEIRLTDERLRGMEAVIASFETRRALAASARAPLAPARVAVLPPAVRLVAARAVTVTVAKPNQEPHTYAQTVGGVMAAVPEDLRETVGRSITEECHVCGNRTITFNSFNGTTISLSGFH